MSPTITKTSALLLITWCLHYPRCNLATTWHHWRHKRLYATFFTHCYYSQRQTPGDIFISAVSHVTSEFLSVCDRGDQIRYFTNKAWLTKCVFVPKSNWSITTEKNSTTWRKRSVSTLLEVFSLLQENLQYMSASVLYLIRVQSKVLPSVCLSNWTLKVSPSPGGVCECLHLFIRLSVLTSSSESH